MILVLGGTKEANLLTQGLKEKGLPFITTVVSAYGASLARKNAQEVLQGCLDREALINLIKLKKINIIIDMTHPYAEEITLMAIECAKELAIPYFRFQRPESVYENSLIKVVDSYEQAAVDAAELACAKKGSVFLTIGSKRAEPFIREGKIRGVRIICRVLPDAQVLKQLMSYGLTPKDIVAALGPFSHSFNGAMFEEYKAAVVVTKDAGRTGGADTKISAALELGIPVLVIKRPSFTGGNVFSETDEILRRVSFEYEQGSNNSWPWQ